MKIDQKDNGKKGTFFIEQNGEIVAEMTYVWTGKTGIIIEHTQVDVKLKGQGAGKQLVTKAIDFARENGLKIAPLCPFVKSVFDKETAFMDVL
ncbi:MAG TPA: GNAT family N-acetyltransferase [Lutibacter sp.]